MKELTYVFVTYQNCDLYEIKKQLSTKFEVEYIYPEYMLFEHQKREYIYNVLPGQLRDKNILLVSEFLFFNYALFNILYADKLIQDGADKEAVNKSIKIPIPADKVKMYRFEKGVLREYKPKKFYELNEEDFEEDDTMVFDKLYDIHAKFLKKDYPPDNEIVHYQ